MQHKFIFLFFLLPLVAESSPVQTNVGLHSQPVSFTITDHLLVSNEKEEVTETRKNKILNGLNIQADYAYYRLMASVSNEFHLEHSSLDQPINLEKKSVQALFRDWEFTLGDRNHELGRGIALSLYSDEVFGVNNTLEGAHVLFRPKGIELGAFAGRVNALKSPIAINPLEPSLEEDTNLWVMGGYGSLPLTNTSRLGSHYFLALNQPTGMTVRRFDKYWNTVGLSFQQDEIMRDLDFYAETNLLLPQTLRKDQYEAGETGVGSYASLVWSPLPWVAKLEVKDYRKYQFPFRRPPSLEEDLVETLNNERVSASRLQLEHRDILKRTRYNASYLVGSDREFDVMVHHGTLGTSFPGPLKTKLELKVGYRTLPGFQNMFHASSKLSVPTFSKQMFELNFLKQRSNLDLRAVARVEDKNKFDLSYTFSSQFSANFGYEYQPSNEVAEQHFFNVGATAKIAGLTAKALVGQTSGGAICSGGVCRQVPPYTGAKLETIYSF